MTEFKFEELSKKTVAQLREIAEGMEHEALKDAAKMPKAQLLAAVCQALGIEAGEAPEETAPEQEPAAQEDEASESAPEGAEEEKPAAKKSEAPAASEKKVEDEEPVAQESKATEPPEESAKEEEKQEEKKTQIIHKRVQVARRCYRNDDLDRVRVSFRGRR